METLAKSIIFSLSDLSPRPDLLYFHHIADQIVGLKKPKSLFSSLEYMRYLVIAKQVVIS
jgi:hypothetical protein